MKTTLFIASALLVGGAGAELDLGKTTMDIYGHVMLDMGYQAGQSDPNWFDVMRPAKLPVYQDQYGADGNWFMGVRQSRLGFKTSTPYGDEEIETIFEFELFGVGSDEGQTTFRLRHAYGEYKHFGAGQYWSVFMDPDVFPNTIEYWGPSGMIFYRNVQFRYIPVKAEYNYVAVSLEQPGASGDAGYDNSYTNATARFPLPDLAAHYRHTQDWGHVQLAGILRYIELEDLGGGGLDDEYIGWGLNLSGNFRIGKDTARLQLVYGEGIGNYLNDGAPDVGATSTAGKAETLPLLGLVAFYDHSWSDKLTSSVGYSMYNIDNSEAQYNSAMKTGHYASGNLLHHPSPNLTYGLELQYGKRINKGSGAADDPEFAGETIEDFDDFRIQFSVKFTFGATLSDDA